LEEDISHCERANDPQKARETICIQLSKLGGTEFHAESVRAEVAAPPFLPVSRWNELRRRLIADLVRRRQRNYIRFQATLAPTAFPHPEKTVDYRANILNAKAKAFYERHGVQVLEFAAESGINLHGRNVMATPFCLRLQYDLCPRQNSEADSADPLWLVDERGIRHLLNFDCAACEMQIIYDPKIGMQSNPEHESLLAKHEPFP
jgi:putative protease